MVILIEKRKIGPKGQVVIPTIFRRNLNLAPGEEVQIRMEDDTIYIEKKQRDIIALMERTAKHSLHINSDKDYEEMRNDRWKKST